MSFLIGLTTSGGLHLSTGVKGSDTLPTDVRFCFNLSAVDSTGAAGFDGDPVISKLYGGIAVETPDGVYRVSFHDNGLGIRDQQGNLLATFAGGQLQHVYETSSGEGYAPSSVIVRLRWVERLIVDFLTTEIEEGKSVWDTLDRVVRDYIPTKANLQVSQHHANLTSTKIGMMVARISALTDSVHTVDGNAVIAEVPDDQHDAIAHAIRLMRPKTWLGKFLSLLHGE